jgi:hypothetical protein
MIGPFATVPGGFTHVLVAIDKFTKRIEFKPIAKLTPDRVVDFISDILHRFGFPNTNSGNSVKIHPSRSNMFRWLTQGQMGKSSGQMA